MALLRIERPTITVFYTNYSSFAKLLEYKKCFKILGISENSEQEQIRAAYLNLVKRYHPDSGTKEADAEKFSQIDKAFRVLTDKKSRERWQVDDEIQVQEQDIKHTAPQHRQYLSYDGVGVGNPFQRQKQYTRIRAQHAADNVLKHRMSKVSAEEGALLAKAPLKHNIKTKYGLERLVEDLIQESMSRGEFSNLSGSGKPLPSHQNRNPYVDFVTHKLNEVLIDNGFTPEWITLQKEIREEIQELRNFLREKRSYLGPCPLSGKDSDDWARIVQNRRNTVELINKKIDKFNLVVPILNKQMIQISLAKEAERILANGQHSVKLKDLPQNTDESGPPVTENIFGIIDSLFKK
ncbi:dnaJ homolog subfamily C member 28 [Tribolium castaneum]|uniref:DnaJ homolog subfamily C member 28-like Protein n=1 Tax=Tribolium castaneum TaxID=7070 RepID=D6WWC0_TRICA|nr:PREDICTED: dnaJ homolog subfamily C member 28 [Tribolium castaneum]EFA08155.1 DnaJ homolog subfamily C member 28-like Protein [Tribolium castaneum]|eukprot:XP_972851.1 PREDICTED: dnaJ homolog subfamily C member 28 [Tribolium castaneum]